MYPNSSNKDLIFSQVCGMLSVVSSSLAGLLCAWMFNPGTYAKVGIPHFSCCMGDRLAPQAKSVMQSVLIHAVSMHGTQ